ncbi:MAG: hypothetical protein JWQ86_5965 [Mycobacterium sp.]|jgi:membrane-bound metal-dependent hydrolase YbcI (DUF457 family)|nr:hypothetical protein [Mycobacterium sp.]MDT5215022.1 hypothetical protein [Mycobacterium sp.]
MLKNWLIEYWWILAAVLYVILLAILARVLNRRGTFEKTWPRITLATTCVIIMLIPTMHSPVSFVVAGICVFNVSILFRSVFKSEKSSEPVDR